MRWAAVLLCSVAVTLATVRSADGQDLIADDHYAYDLRALGDVVTWVHGTYDENGPHGPVVELYRHVDGRTTAARCCADQEYQDLGRDRRGRIVQVLGYSGGFGSVGQHAPPPPVFMLYDVRADRIKQFRPPPVPAGCVVNDVAVWFERTAVAATCPAGQGRAKAAFFLATGRRAQPLMELPLKRGDEHDTVAHSVVLDVTNTGVTSSVYTETSHGDETSSLLSQAWLLRQGCSPSRLVRAEGYPKLGPVRLDGARTYWEAPPRGRVARVLARRILPDCKLGGPRTILRLRRAPQRFDPSLAVVGRRAFYVVEDVGVLRRTLR